MTAYKPLLFDTGGLRAMGSSDQMTLPDGTASLPSLKFTHGGVYDNGSGVTVAASATTTYEFDTTTPTFQSTGGATFILNFWGEGTTGLQFERFSNTAGGGIVRLWKSRGPISAPAVPQTADTLGSLNFGGYTTGTAQQGSNSATISAVVTETTWSATTLGTQIQFSACANLSASLTDMVYIDNAAGLQMFGANKVIDQFRDHIGRVRTVATKPSNTSGGLYPFSDLEGGQGYAYGGALAIRNIQNNQIIQATISGQGVLSKMTGYCDFAYRAIVNNTMQKLKDAGLLSGKMLALAMPAMPTNVTDAALNWITPGTNDLVVTGSPTWAANQGFTGDAATALLTFGTATLAQLGVASTDDVSMFCFVRTANTSGAAAKAVMGQNSVAQSRQFYLQSFTSGTFANTKFLDTNNDTFTPARFTGLFVMSRTAAHSYNVSVDDATATNFGRDAVVLNARVPAWLGTADTTASEFSNAEVSVLGIGKGLTAADIANLRAIFEDYYLVQVGARSAVVANLPPAANYTGQTYYVGDLGGGAALIQSDGTNWFRAGGYGYEARTLATGSETITYLTNAENVEYTATLTGNCTVTLSGTDAKGSVPKKGAKFVITHNNATPGAFTFAIVNGGAGAGTLITFASATNKAAIFVFDGTNWRLSLDAAI